MQKLRKHSYLVSGFTYWIFTKCTSSSIYNLLQQQISLSCSRRSSEWRWECPTCQVKCRLSNRKWKERSQYPPEFTRFLLRPAVTDRPSGHTAALTHPGDGALLPPLDSGKVFWDPDEPGAAVLHRVPHCPFCTFFFVFGSWSAGIWVSVTWDGNVNRLLEVINDYLHF